MQRRARKTCGSKLPNRRRGREQYTLGHCDTVRSTASLAVVVLFLTICIGPCQCQTAHCAAGSTGPSPEQCVLCVAGKYKNSTGSAKCTNCTAGKYSSVVGAASDVCQPCPVTVYSPEGSSSQDACVCGVAMSQKVYVLPTITCTGGCPCPGAPQQSNGEMRSQSPKIHWYDPPTRYVIGLSCIWTIVADRPISLTFSEFSVCPAWVLEFPDYVGQYCGSVNIYTCTSAACSSRTLAKSFTPLSRPPTTLLTSNIIRIHFNSGRERDTGWVMQWSIASLASMPMLCEWCEKGKFKSSTDGENCDACVPGKYKSDVGSSACENCVAGTYNNGSYNIQCNSCPTGSSSPNGGTAVTDCKCNSGYTGDDGGVCSACVPGKYKVAVGAIPGVCQACPSNSDTAAEASDVVTDCICNVGWTGSGGGTPCSACVTGTYKSSTGSEACENCIAGTYSTTSSAVTPLACLSCPLNSDAAEASDSPADCICNAGFSGMHGGPCTQCTIGKYSTAQ